jgi:hypothetical protein
MPQYMYLTYNPIYGAGDPGAAVPYGQGALSIEVALPDNSGPGYLDIVNPLVVGFTGPAGPTGTINLETYATNTINVYLENYSPNYAISGGATSNMYINFNNGDIYYTDTFTSFSTGPSGTAQLSYGPFTYTYGSVPSWYQGMYSPFTGYGNPFIMISNNPTFGAGSINNGVASVTNVIGPVNASISPTTYSQSGGDQSFDINLPDWDWTYISSGAVTVNQMYLYLAGNTFGSTFTLGPYPIPSIGPPTVGTDLIFTINSGDLSSLPNDTYIIYITDSNTNIPPLPTIGSPPSFGYLCQGLTNTLTITS